MARPYATWLGHPFRSAHGRDAAGEAPRTAAPSIVVSYADSNRCVVSGEPSGLPPEARKVGALYEPL
jgi:hypothetical protein